MGEREQRMEAKGFKVDVELPPGAIYRPVSRNGNTLYVSGAVPIENGCIPYKGKVPSVVSLEDAQKAAAICVANNLRMVYQELGSFDDIECIVRLTGYVNTDLDFTEQHVVINGGSQLLLDIFGDDGLAARTAIGVAQLPLNSSVETEMIIKLKD